MAGNAKPNVPDLRAEVTLKFVNCSQINSNSSSASAGDVSVFSRLFDGTIAKQGIYGAIMLGGSPSMWFEFEVDVPIKTIWSIGNIYSDSGGTSPKDVKLYKWNGIEYALVGQYPTKADGTWYKLFENLGTGKYKVENVAKYVEFDEWYVEMGYVNKILLSSGENYYSLAKPAKVSAVPVMTSASNNDVEITASAYNASDFPWKAFDGVAGSTTRPFWYTQSGPPSGGHWLQVKFSNPKAITGISLTSLLVTGTSHSIKDFELYGSNDGSVFEKLYSNTQLNVDAKIYYDFVESTKAYSYYRLNILSSYNNTSTVGVNEMEIFEKKNQTIYVLQSGGESEFIQYGMEGDTPFNKAVDKVKNVIKMNLPLGSSKSFEHTIDMSKHRVDKITLG